MVASPKYSESLDIAPIALQPQTPAQPTQPTVVCLLASAEGTTVCFELPLQSPPPPSPGGRLSHATGDDFKGGRVLCRRTIARHEETKVLKSNHQCL